MLLDIWADPWAAADGKKPHERVAAETKGERQCLWGGPNVAAALLLPFPGISLFRHFFLLLHYWYKTRTP